MKKNQRKKLWLGIVVGAIVGTVTLVALGIIFLLLVFFGGPADITTNITKYEKKITQYSMRTALITFPEQIPDSAEDVDFYFYYKDTWNTPTCEVFLQCTYDEADYRAEVERLENTYKKYGSAEWPLLRDEEGRFPYPAYIAVDSHLHAYEYALLSGERQITYIYTAYRKADELHKVEEKYLPSDFDSRQEQSGIGEGYCIYLMGENTDLGVRSYEYDYTRDTIVMQ